VSISTICIVQGLKSNQMKISLSTTPMFIVCFFKDQTDPFVDV